jgi:hypothetical protein
MNVKDCNQHNDFIPTFFPSICYPAHFKRHVMKNKVEKYKQGWLTGGTSIR